MKRRHSEGGSQWAINKQHNSSERTLSISISSRWDAIVVDLLKLIICNYCTLCFALIYEMLVFFYFIFWLWLRYKSAIIFLMTASFCGVLLEINKLIYLLGWLAHFPSNRMYSFCCCFWESKAELSFFMRSLLFN